LLLNLAGFDFLAKLLEIGDGLLKDVAKYFHIDDGGTAVLDGVFLDRLGIDGAELIGCQLLECGTDFIGYDQRFEQCVRREQPSVVLRHAQRWVSLIDGAEQATEVFPAGTWMVGIDIVMRISNGIRRQQATIFSEGTEEYPVQELLRCGEDVLRIDGGVQLRQPVKDLATDVGVLEIEIPGDIVANDARLLEDVIEVTSSG